jgi:hypothetical protein
MIVVEMLELMVSLPLVGFGNISKAVELIAQ